MAALNLRPDNLFPSRGFRERLHDCFEPGADALFELKEAMVAGVPVSET